MVGRRRFTGRRGVATLELVMGAPFLILMLVFILGMAQAGIERSFAAVEARYKTWAKRPEASTDGARVKDAYKPKAEFGDDFIKEEASRAIVLVGMLKSLNATAKSDHTVIAGPWDQRTLDEIISPAAPRWFNPHLHPMIERIVQGAAGSVSTSLSSLGSPGLGLMGAAPKPKSKGFEPIGPTAPVGAGPGLSFAGARGAAPKFGSTPSVPTFPGGANSGPAFNMTGGPTFGGISGKVPFGVPSTFQGTSAVPGGFPAGNTGSATPSGGSIAGFPSQGTGFSTGSPFNISGPSFGTGATGSVFKSGGSTFGFGGGSGATVSGGFGGSATGSFGAAGSANGGFGGAFGASATGSLGGGFGGGASGGFGGGASGGFGGSAGASTSGGVTGGVAGSSGGRFDSALGGLIGGGSGGGAGGGDGISSALAALQSTGGGGSGGGADGAGDILKFATSLGNPWGVIQGGSDSGLGTAVPKMAGGLKNELKRALVNELSKKVLEYSPLKFLNDPPLGTEPFSQVKKLSPIREAIEAVKDELNKWTEKAAGPMLRAIDIAFDSLDATGVVDIQFPGFKFDDPLAVLQDLANQGTGIKKFFTKILDSIQELIDKAEEAAKRAAGGGVAGQVVGAVAGVVGQVGSAILKQARSVIENDLLSQFGKLDGVSGMLSNLGISLPGVFSSAAETER